MTNAKISDTQYGFSKGKGVSFACSLLSVTIHYHKYKNSFVYMCSLDAEKCFDSIYHTSLFYKLISVPGFNLLMTKLDAKFNSAMPLLLHEVHAIAVTILLLWRSYRTAIF